MARRQNHVYLNVYLSEQLYGGPEEGGWWYFAGEPIKSVRVRDASMRSDSLHENLTKEINELNEGQPPITSVLSNGRYILSVEDHPARAYPERTPHYE